MSSPLSEVVREFSKLGFVAFGGPPAHVALMLKRFADGQPGSLGWIPEASFASLFALTQCLPGPSSTQLATALGALHAGIPGAIAAFVCFDMTGFVVMSVTGITMYNLSAAALPAGLAGVLTLAQVGLGAAAVGLLAHAALTLTSKCAPDRLTKALATGSAAATVLFSGAPPAVLFPIVLIIGGVATSIEARYKPVATAASATAARPPADSEAGGDKARLLSSPGAATYGRTVALALFAVWPTLFLLLFLGAGAKGSLVDLAGSFFRTGSLVWGGGQVVLPMLLRELTPTWMAEEAFIRGYALVQARRPLHPAPSLTLPPALAQTILALALTLTSAATHGLSVAALLVQALPGPVFNLSAYLGGVAAGVPGALVAWASLFLPGLLLILAALPFWVELQSSARMAAALRGVNAAASGLVVAAALILAQGQAYTLPQQVVAMVCFVGIQFFGVHQAAAILGGAVLGVPLCAALECTAE